MRKIEPLSADQIDQLDPGVRTLVQVVRALGYETTDSGDGSKFGDMDGALPFPHVCARISTHLPAMHAVQAAHSLHRRLADAIRFGRMPEVKLAVEVSYSTADKIAILTVLGIMDSDLDPAAVADILKHPLGARDAGILR